MPIPSHPPWLDHPNNIWYSVQIVQLLNMQSFPASCHFLHLQSRFSTQHPARIYLHRDEVPHLIYIFWSVSFQSGGGKTKVSEVKCGRHSLTFICSWILLECSFVSLLLFPKILIFAAFSKDLLEKGKLWFCPAFWWRNTITYLVSLVYFKINLPTSL